MVVKFTSSSIANGVFLQPACHCIVRKAYYAGLYLLLFLCKFCSNTHIDTSLCVRLCRKKLTSVYFAVHDKVKGLSCTYQTSNGIYVLRINFITIVMMYKFRLEFFFYISMYRCVSQYTYYYFQSICTNIFPSTQNSSLITSYFGLYTFAKLFNKV